MALSVIVIAVSHEWLIAADHFVDDCKLLKVTQPQCGHSARRW